MLYTTAQELHIERVHNTKSSGQELIVGASSIEPFVERSWHRCINEYGLSPSLSPSPYILDENELHDYEEVFSETKELAQNSVNQLYRHIADIGYTILLTNGHGITLDCRYNLESKKMLKKLGLYNGTNWSENLAGTNGVGTSIVEEKSVSVRAGEHFFPEMLGVSCVVSPIFDSKGKVMASLNASTLLPETINQNKLISRLVEQYARKIEFLSFAKDFSDHWILRFSTNNDVSDILSVGVLAINEDGVIISGNRYAYALLQKKFGSNLNNKFIHDIFELDFSKIVDNFNKNVPVINQIRALDRCSTFFFEISPPSIAKKYDSIPLKQNNHSKNKCKKHPNLAAMTGNDIHMQILANKIKQIINQELHVLLVGETGSGKEALARAIHDESNRKEKPFIAINCAAIPDSLIESELFGYSSGTFTGALKKGMKGKVLEANGGTLFLDEIGDMPLHLQTRLLRMLSEMEVIPLGDTTPIYLDIQLISATNRSIAEMIEEDTFRKDLYYRLNGITLEIPSLRDRTDKQELITSVFEAYSSVELIKISDKALEILKEYQWPGNIRQLINIAKYSNAMCSNGIVMEEDLPNEIQVSQSNNIKDNLNISEYEVLLNSLKVNKWNITNVSKQLGICRATVYRKINKYSIVSPNDA